MIELGPNRYGKSAIRLVKIIRHADRHEVRDLITATVARLPHQLRSVQAGVDGAVTALAVTIRR